MARDPETFAHQEWLGYVQPVGLVVSIPALLNAQAYVNRNIAPDHQRFISCLRRDKDDEPIPVIDNFPKFCQTVFGWRDADLEPFSDANPQLASLKITLPEYHENLEPTHVVRELEPKDPTHPWMMLICVLSPETDLDIVATADHRNWQATPQSKFERLLRETRVPLGLLCNHKQIRIVYAPRGETSGHMTFGVAEMAQVAGRPIFAALHMLLCEPRLFTLGEKQRLPAILTDSRKYQNVVSTKLAEQVLASLYELVRGFQAANEQTNGVLLHDVLAHDANHVYNGLLTVLMRLVFVLFAEDRDLISNDSVYSNHYSVTGLFERLRADAGRYPDTMDLRYGAWAQLLTLFRLIYQGGSHDKLKIPPRHGYLFDPDRYNFLEGRPWKTASDRHDGKVEVPHVSDGVVFRVLSNLLILDGERLSYRMLDVEQIGSVYEVTMGFGLGVAKGATIAIKPKVRLGAPVPIDLDELLTISAAERAKWVKTNTDQEITGEAAAALKAAASVPNIVAALERRIAHTATPSVIHKGGMVPIPSDERRRSGSNYTPRSLTQPIVETTLRPVLQRLGEKPTPQQILDLKVCDPAMGSGAFLVEACRQLGDELVKAWHTHKKVPVIPPDEDEVLHARRLVAQRCLYGVDRNPMAVDLAKLSLWLATLAKDHPFTFLDHNFRCGDSLVGLTRDQIARFHWLPVTERRLDVSRIESRVTEAAAHRQKILSAGDSVPHEQKWQELALADEQLDSVRWYGDLVVATFFEAENEKNRKAKREENLRELTTYLAPGPLKLEARPKAADALRKGRRGVVPFHWEIEFPEVFDCRNAGFDAIVGNPPFMGGVKISGTQGVEYLSWLKTNYFNEDGNADLVAYFFRRAFGLLSSAGCAGLVATNSIAQGDTRRTGLAHLLKAGAVIYAAERRFPWPGSAAVIVSIVHFSRDAVHLTEALLDGKSVPRISAFLFDAGGDDDPASLKFNSEACFRGVVIYGSGFILSRSEGAALIEKCERNKECVLPFLTGEDVNEQVQSQFDRYVINFGTMTLEEVSQWPDLLAIVESRVKPERDCHSHNAIALRQKEYWWRFRSDTPHLRAAIAPLTRCLAASRVSKHVCFSFQPIDQVFSEATNVFAFASSAAFASLQSRCHEIWARFFGSSLEDRLRYNPSDCFETYPFPENFEADLRLASVGQIYYEFRAALMVKHNEGLTKTYNRFHDRDHDANESNKEIVAGIVKLRELNAAMDRAVLDAYGWTDIPTDCQYLLDYVEEEDETDTPAHGRGRKKPWRYRWPDEVRDEVLARLLEENKKRAEQERIAGARDHSPKKKPPRQKKGPQTLNQDLFGAE